MRDFFILITIMVVVFLLSWFLFEYTTRMALLENYQSSTLYLEQSEEIFHRNNKLINNGSWRDL